MKICWDNLEKVRYRPDRGQWKDIRYTDIFYICKDECDNCKEPFLSQVGNLGMFCSMSCRALKNNPMKNSKILKKRSGKNHHMKKPEMRKKFSGKNHPMYGKKNPGYSECLKKRNLLNNPMKRPEIIRKVSGPNSHFWRGGIAADPYCPLWLDKEYKESIKERDEYRCQNCGKAEKLCVHHINYDKKDCRPINLITLCLSCNSKANYQREYWQKLYEEKLCTKKSLQLDLELV